MRIEGVELRPIQLHKDDRGWLFEALRSDDSMFRSFGQAYIVRGYKAQTRGGHVHKFTWDYFVPIQGAVEALLVDLRPGPSCGHSERFWIYADDPKGIMIPPGVWHRLDARWDEGFIGLGLPSRAYDPENPDRREMTFEEAQKESAEHTIEDVGLVGGFRPGEGIRTLAGRIQE